MQGVGTCAAVGGTGGGGGVEELRTKTSRTFGSGIIGGATSSTWTPPAPLPTSKYYQYHSQRSDSSGAGVPGWAESVADSQALAAACQRWEVSEGSLPLTMAGNLGTEQSCGGREVRGERECTDQGGGGGHGYFSRGKKGNGYVTWREAGGEVGSLGEKYFGGIQIGQHSQRNQKGTESSLSQASVQTMEHQHPNMRRPQVRGDRPRKRGRRRYPTKIIIISY